MRPVTAVHAQDKLGPGGDRHRDLRRVEAVDRDPKAPVSKRGHGIANLRPGRSRVASQVDHVRPLRAKPLGFVAQFVARQPRRMVDLGQDLDAVLAVSGIWPPVLAEVPRQVAEILGARFDRGTSCFFRDRGQITPAVSGQDHAVDSLGNFEMSGNPFGRHQRGHRDRQHGDLGRETGSRGELVEHAPQCELGQPAGHKEIPGTIECFCSSSTPAPY